MFDPPGSLPEVWLAPLDLTRAAVLRALGKPGRDVLRRRELRVALYGALGVASAFVLTLTAPLRMLTIGPLAFGVPHLLADLRYLVVRPRLHHRALFWPLLALPLFFTWFVPHAFVGLGAVVGAALAARGHGWRRWIALSLATACAVLAYAFQTAVDAAMAYGHNLVALGLWWAWRPRPSDPWKWLPVLLFGAGSVALLSPCLAVFPCFAGGTVSAVSSRSDAQVDQQLVPFLTMAAPAWGPRLVLFFAFSQAVHYSVWLRLIPEEDRERPGIRSFASSFRALRQDFGSIVLVAFGAVAALLAVDALGDVYAARLAYLRLAAFHGPLELAVMAGCFIERRAFRAS